MPDRLRNFEALVYSCDDAVAPTVTQCITATRTEAGWELTLRISSPGGSDYSISGSGASFDDAVDALWEQEQQG